MAFDWLTFLDQHRIEYTSAGSNMGRGHIAIRCPWCGDDPSHHLEVSLDKPVYKCWRNQTQHKGNWTWLVKTLLGCSIADAQAIVGSKSRHEGNLEDFVSKLFDPASVAPDKRRLKLLDEFKPFVEGKPSARPFIRYLDRRGFWLPEPEQLTARYGLRYTTRGPFSDRIIFPVIYEGRLIAWTARTIHNLEPRYKALTIDAESAAKQGIAPALGPISHYLLWYDRLMKCNAHTIILVEGPFDAMKVDLLGRAHGIRATCCFTAAPTDNQIMHSRTLFPRFKRRCLLLDRGAVGSTMHTIARLATLRVEALHLPEEFKDPGELQTTKQLLDILA